MAEMKEIIAAHIEKASEGFFVVHHAERQGVKTIPEDQVEVFLSQGWQVAQNPANTPQNVPASNQFSENTDDEILARFEGIEGVKLYLDDKDIKYRANATEASLIAKVREL